MKVEELLGVECWVLVWLEVRDGVMEGSELDFRIPGDGGWGLRDWGKTQRKRVLRVCVMEQGGVGSDRNEC